MVPAGNKAKCLSSLSHTTKTIHYHQRGRNPINYKKSWKYGIGVDLSKRGELILFQTSFLKGIIFVFRNDSIVKIVSYI